jgi:hypothetical protein
MHLKCCDYLFAATELRHHLSNFFSHVSFFWFHQNRIRVRRWFTPLTTSVYTSRPPFPSDKLFPSRSLSQLCFKRDAPEVFHLIYLSPNDSHPHRASRRCAPCYCLARRRWHCSHRPRSRGGALPLPARPLLLLPLPSLSLTALTSPIFRLVSIFCRFFSDLK